MKHHMPKWNFVFDDSQRMLLEFLCSSADWFKLSADDSETSTLMNRDVVLNWVNFIWICF